jgi:hypothetical protein
VSNRSSLPLSRLTVEGWRLYRALFGRLMLAAVVVLVPVSLLDAVADRFSTVGEVFATGELVRAIAAAVIGALLSLLGEVFYAAIVTEIVCNHRGVHREALAGGLRSLPYARLALADIVYAVVASLGFILLVAPGLVFMTWFALIAPVIEVERIGIRAAMRRSRELVRGHFWKVFLVVIPLSFVVDFAFDALEHSVADVLGETFVAEWASAALAEIITAPFLALFVVLAYLELSAFRTSDRQ